MLGDWEVHATTPRTQLRGLIEAGRPGEPPTGSRGLRGLSSAASLKLAHRGLALARESGLRGLSSAASLKPMRALCSVRSTTVTPRTQLRGLIEARRMGH